MRRASSRLLAAFLATSVLAPAYADVSYPPHLTKAYLFTGGPVATLGTITGGSGYVDNTYPGVSLTGGSCVGVVGTVTVSGGSVAAVVITNPGAPITPTGAVGCLIGDILTAANTALGGTGSGFSVPVATRDSYTFHVPGVSGAGTLVMLLDACGAGAGGGSGQSSSGAGGSGGGSGSVMFDQPLITLPGSDLTIALGTKGKGGTVGNDDATNGGSTSIAGAGLYQPIATLSGGNHGLPGAAGTGGVGGGGGSPAQGNGGASGAAGSPATTPSMHYSGGSGGGGGGATATSPGQGGGTLLSSWGGAAAGTGVGGGGGGARSQFGDGGRGGNGGGTPSAGASPPNGYCGGGGGGGVTQVGADGAPAFARLRF